MFGLFGKKKTTFDEGDLEKIERDFGPDAIANLDILQPIDREWLSYQYEMSRQLYFGDYEPEEGEPEPKKNVPDYFFSFIKKYNLFIWLVKEKYLSVLERKAKQLIYRDEYDDLCFDDFYREMNGFVEKRLHSILSATNDSADQFYKDMAENLGLTYHLLFNPVDEFYSAYDLIGDIASEVIDIIFSHDDFCSSANSEFETLLDVEDPYEYERAVAESLAALGWLTNTTSGSGDQGADVVAEKVGVRLVIQTKLYSKPVGNKAVQEIHAAKGFYGAHFAAVVTNSTYTKSARKLADNLGVILLHHDELSVLDALAD